MRSQIDRIRQAIAPASCSVRSALSSLRSPPETNARSPAPVITSAAAPSAPSSALSNWSIVSSEMALRACGRSMVMTARPSANSRSTIGHSPSAVLAFSVAENSITTERRCRCARNAKNPARADKTVRTGGVVETRNPRRSHRRRTAGRTRHRLLGALRRPALRGHLRRRRSASSSAGRRSALARRGARRRGRDPAAQLDGGRGRRSGRRRSSAPSWCRSCTSTAARNWPHHLPSRARRRSSPPRNSGG